jgi:hypothetical protein
MRKMFLFSTLFFAAALFACPGHGNQDFTFRIDEQNGKIRFVVEKVLAVSTGPLLLDRIEIKRPTSTAPGFLGLQIKSDPIDAGPITIGASGTFLFSRGVNLPDLKEGAYDLFLNGVYYGQLFIRSDGVDYFSMVQCEHE